MKKAIKILSLNIALIMILSVLAIPVGAESFVGVAFEGENSYEIYGKTGNTAENVQVIRNYYKNGAFEKSEYGNSYTIGANQEFTYSESVSTEDGESIEVFLVESQENPTALTEKYSYNNVSFEYTLDSDCSTSAGVYDENGTLIRTLWSAKEETAGTKTGIWDGKDDYGRYMKDGNYTVKILSSNVKYELDGLIGNNTKLESQITNMSNANFMCDMTYADGNMYYAEQYAESTYAWRRFDTNDPHILSGYLYGTHKYSVRCTSDGETVYWLALQSLAESSTGDEIPKMFVAGLDIVSNTEVEFDEGISLWRSKIGNPGIRYKSVVGIEYYPEYTEDYLVSAGGMYNTFVTENYLGDIAVSDEHYYLAVAFPKRDYVTILNKYTGAVMAQNTIDAQPTMLSYDNEGNLWVVSSAEIACYSISESGSMTKIAAAPESTMIDNIVGFEVSPSGEFVVLLYGGDTNKVMAYNLSDWSLRWSLGSGESYKESPEVKEDKFLFRSFYDRMDYSFVAFEEDDNTLWFGDPGNMRSYKLDLSCGMPVIADTIHMRTVGYHAFVDTNDPTRVFTDHYEYEIDYSKDIKNCWTLKNNWMYFTEPYLTAPGVDSYMDYVTTFSNGRTYFLGTDKESGVQYVYELTDTGIRNTGINADGYTMSKDGNGTLQRAGYITVNGKKEKAIFKRYLQGFDGENPIWGDDVFVGYIPAEELGKYTLVSTSAVGNDNLAVLYNGGTSNVASQISDSRVDMRIAAVKLSPDYEDFNWEWKTSPATSTNYYGNFPRDGAFEVNAWYSSKYGPQLYNRNILMQYHGEGYHQAQTNIFYHFYDNGLLVGVYGNALGQQMVYEDYDQQLVNGNGFRWQLVNSPVDSDIAYIYQGSEMGMSGVLRSKLTGLNSIKEQEALIAYKNGLINGFDEEKGYIEKPKDAGDSLKLFVYTDGEAEVIIDDEVCINGTGVKSCELKLEDDRIYPISIDVSNNTYFKLMYENEAGIKKDFPSVNIYTEASDNILKVSERNLLENVPYNVSDKSLIEGWNFNIDDSLSHKVRTNVYNYDATQDNDIDIHVTTIKGTSYEVTKDLGEVQSFADMWEIDTNMMYFGHPTGEYNTGTAIAGSLNRYMDVLDVNGKVIARFYVSNEDYSPYGNGTKIKTLEKPTQYTQLDKRYIHELAVPFDFKITGADGKIFFTFNQNTVTTEVYESGADWSKPKALRLSVSHTANMGANSEYVFKRLKFNQYDSDYVKTVSFYDENNNLLSSIKAKKNTEVLPPIYEKEGYIISWSKDTSCVTEDMAVTAVVTKDTTEYKVNFYDENGTLVETKTGQYGVEITPPSAEKEGYRLVWTTEDGGKPDFVNRTSDINVYAKYEPIHTQTEDFSDFTINMPKYSSDGSKIKSGSMETTSGMRFYANDSAYKVASMESGYFFMNGRAGKSYSPENLWIHFDKFESGTVNVEFRFKFLNHSASQGTQVEFASLYDSNGKCVAILASMFNGLYVHDGKAVADLITNDTTAWHTIEYKVDMESKKFELIFDGTSIGKYNFRDKTAENVNALCFKGPNALHVTQNGIDWYMEYIKTSN